MAHSAEIEILSKAFTGIGVDEKSLVTILGKSHPEQRKSFRKGNPKFFVADERQFERWDDKHVKLLKREFLRFKTAVVLWTMHPWERDARLMKKALKSGPQSYGVLVEIACTRSAEELLGARRAYHSLYDHSIEEDVASHIAGRDRKLLVALVSAYRYEGQKVKDDSAKSEAKILCTAIRNAEKKHPLEDEEVIRILTTRSKPHLIAMCKHYKAICGKGIDTEANADLRLKETVECLCTPHLYFTWVLDAALKSDVADDTKNALTRVMVTRADVDMKAIGEEYHRQHGVTLSKTIEDRTNGNYKDLLLILAARGN